MKKIMVLLVCVGLAAMFSCGKGGGGGDDGGDKMSSGDCANGGWCGEQSLNVTADLGGSDALFIASESSSVLSDISTEKAVTVSTESPLFSVTTSGIISVLAAELPDHSDALSQLPRLSFVAVSPIGHVILVFEHPFIYTDEVDEIGIEDYTDPWASSSPFTCQVFVVNKKISDIAAGDDPEGVTCITNELEINTWDSRSAMVQFDGDGGVYFTAHVPNNWKNVLVKWTPGTDDSSTEDVDESTTEGTLGEVINANICFREFLVTNEGGVLYTGITSTTGDCNGTSFLRYKTPADSLQEITSGWWEYVFKPIESTDFVSTDISADITAGNVGQILFYGPDPESPTVASWDNSCLFQFNPDASGDARSIQIADCENDIWHWANFDDDDNPLDLATQKARCIGTKSMMGGGNMPKKILMADLNGDGSDYEIYIAGSFDQGNLYEKRAGEWKYDICVNEDVNEGGGGNGHCAINGVPDYANRDDQADCVAAGGTWKDYRDCYNQLTDSDLYDIMAADDFEDSNWQLNSQRCESPGGDWRDTYSAFAWIIHSDADPATPGDDSDDTRQIVRLSDNTERVKNGWNINNTLVYSSQIAQGDDAGEYKLRKIVWTDANENGTVDITDDNEDGVPDEITKVDLLTGIEVYELFADPRSDYAGKWFFNGLNFVEQELTDETTIPGNSYITGTFDPSDDDPMSTLRAETGFTGQIETLVIVPSF